MKKKIIWISFVLIHQFCFSQRIISKNELSVILDGQKKSSWCWDACITMIYNYHTTPIKNQCDIYSLKYSSCSPNCDVCLGSDCNDLLGLTTNVLTPGSLTLIQTPANNFSLIFENLNFHSLETLVSSISINEVKSEIDCNHPFIVSFSRDDTGKAYHSVVVNGYIETDDDFLLMIKDPWAPCDGCYYLLSISSLNDSSGTIGQIRHKVTEIYPNSNPCNIVAATTSKNIKKNTKSKKNTPEIIASNYLKMFLKSDKIMANRFFGKYQSKKIKWNKLPTREISHRKILNNIKSDLLMDSQEVTLYSDEHPEFNVTLRKIDDFWIIESIKTCSYLCKKDIKNGLIDCNNDKLFTTQNGINISMLIPELIYYQILGYKFECFRTGHLEFCGIREKIPDFTVNGKLIEPFIAYPKASIFESIQKMGINFEIDLKNRYPNVSSYVR